MHPSDQELIEKVKRKDKQAFVELFDKYRDKVFGFIYGYLGNYEEAQDVVVETFMNAYTNIGDFKGRSKFSTWLYQIAKNFARRKLRAKRHHKEVSLEEPIDEEGAISLNDLIADDSQRPDYNLRVADMKDFIYKLLSKLDEKYKEVLLLCDIKGLSYDEAGKILKCNPITVGTRVRRARKQFYKLLQKYRAEL